MRITIETLDGPLRSSTAVSSPSAISQSSAAVAGRPSEALSGGEAAPPAGGVVASLRDASSTGAAEQDNGLAATGAARATEARAELTSACL